MGILAYTLFSLKVVPSLEPSLSCFVQLYRPSKPIKSPKQAGQVLILEMALIKARLALQLVILNHCLLKLIVRLIPLKFNITFKLEGQSDFQL